jgi:hypothetical protein
MEGPRGDQSRLRSLPRTRETPPIRGGRPTHPEYVEPRIIDRVAVKSPALQSFSHEIALRGEAGRRQATEHRMGRRAPDQRVGSSILRRAAIDPPAIASRLHPAARTTKWGNPPQRLLIDNEAARLTSGFRAPDSAGLATTTSTVQHRSGAWHAQCDPLRACGDAISAPFPQSAHRGSMIYSSSFTIMTTRSRGLPRTR